MASGAGEVGCYRDRVPEWGRPPSSSGLGRLPFKEVTRVRIPLGVLFACGGLVRANDSGPDGASRRTPTGVGELCSLGAADGDIERGADFTHALAAQRSQPVDEYGDRDALDRIEIHGAWTWYGILAGFEQNLARQPSDCCGAGGDKDPT